MQGWKSDFNSFISTDSRKIIKKLDEIFPSSIQQLVAWEESIPDIQNAVGEVIGIKTNSQNFYCVLEYELPFESRRPDSIFLTDTSVIVAEIKTTGQIRYSDLDQVDAYARDLRAYHRYCHNIDVLPVLVLMGKKNFMKEKNGIIITSPDKLDKIILSNASNGDITHTQLTSFLSDEAYSPLPTLVKAARELFQNRGKLTRIHKASALTDPAIETMAEIAVNAHKEKKRKLILLTGVPGAGKTLVGLRLVHSEFLDSIKSQSSNSNVPAVFLSGNGPLVEVLQYELKDAGGGGKTFVRGVKDYVKRYSRNSALTPPENILVFDEAQRAWDKYKVALNHGIDPAIAKSEPEHFIEFAERIPDWCMVVGLIGTGQEIHLGEEGGIIQWAKAISNSPKSSEWSIYGPETLKKEFGDYSNYNSYASLSLDEEIRFHSSQFLHIYIENLLQSKNPQENKKIADLLTKNSYHLRITRNIDQAKEYLKSRYLENSNARFGMVASSKDKDLYKFSIPNDFQSTKVMKLGPWYGDEEDHPNSKSCRLLHSCVTEFGAQGLELDAALIAWGTDFVQDKGSWDTSNARGYRDRHLIKDAFQLRKNSYRVLLTRGRDANIVFIPELRGLDETYDYLVKSGFEIL